MGTFNFSPNHNTMLNFNINEFIKDNYVETQDKYELSDYVIYDMQDYAQNIQEFIHDGLNKIWDKYYNYLSSDDASITYDDFQKIIFIQNGYYEGFCVCLENIWNIDIDVARRDDIMKDIIDLYKTIPNQFTYLEKTKHCGWAGQQTSDWFFEWKPMDLEKAKKVFFESLNELDFSSHAFLNTELWLKWAATGILLPSEAYAIEQTSFYKHLSDLYSFDKELEKAKAM